MIQISPHLYVGWIGNDKLYLLSIISKVKGEARHTLRLFLGCEGHPTEASVTPLIARVICLIWLVSPVLPRFHACPSLSCLVWPSRWPFPIKEDPGHFFCQVSASSFAPLLKPPDKLLGSICRRM